MCSPFGPCEAWHCREADPSHAGLRQGGDGERLQVERHLEPQSHRRRNHQALLGCSVLGVVLGLASRTGTLAGGVVLLFAYSLGLALPFVLVEDVTEAIRLTTLADGVG